MVIPSEVLFIVENSFAILFLFFVVLFVVVVIPDEFEIVLSNSMKN